MDKMKLNFYCPTSTVKVLDELAAADHRDRTSMLNKIIDFYLQRNGHAIHALHPKTTTKKAGAR